MTNVCMKNIDMMFSLNHMTLICITFHILTKYESWLTPKMDVFGYFGGTENGTSGARIKILRPLFNTNTPPKTPI